MAGGRSLGKIAGLLLAACLLPSCHSAVTKSSRIGDAGRAKSAAPADNAECHVCHADFKTEALSVEHEKAGIGCFDCHGPSTDHGDDEWNIALPDVLFGRAEITPFCTTCHEKEDHPKGEKYQAFVKKWTGKYRPNGRMIRDTSICTDCHGNHAVLTPDQQQFPGDE